MSEAKLARRMGRRATMLAPLLPLVAAFVACSPRRGEPTPPRPSLATSTTERKFFPKVPIVTPAAPRVESSPEWNQLPAFIRIQRLETLLYPSIEKFDARKELILASAQFYCEQTKCKIKPEKMADSIFFVSPSQFIEEVEKDFERKLSDEEREDQLKTRPEIVNRKNESFINKDLIDEFMEFAKRDNPEGVRQLGNLDFKTVYTKSLLFHIFSHMNQIDSVYSFSGFSLRGIRTKTRVINVPNIDRLEGFAFVGETEGKQSFYINGTHEAVTELTAITIGKKSGIYLSIVPRFNRGAMLIDMFNNRSGITDQEFLEYANGTRPIKDFLTKWGRLKNASMPDEKAAILALAHIGLFVDGFMEYQETRQDVENLLRQQASK